MATKRSVIVTKEYTMEIPNTKNTHLENSYENGMSDPITLLESPVSDQDKYISYSLSTIASTITEYNGYIPDSDEVPVYVWHYANSIQYPKQYVPIEYKNIDATFQTLDDQSSIKEAIDSWSDTPVDSTNYKEKLYEYVQETEDKRNPYSSALLTCTCGDRLPYESVSEAFAESIHNHSSENHNTSLWLYCGVINSSVREYARSIYEGAKSKHTSILDRVTGEHDQSKPIDTVPIYRTPLSIALTEVGCFDTTEHTVGYNQDMQENEI